MNIPAPYSPPPFHPQLKATINILFNVPLEFNKGLKNRNRNS